MSLDQLLEEKNYATALDNVELMAEDEGSVLYTDPVMKQKVIEALLSCASDNDHLNLLRRTYDFFALLASVNLLPPDQNYHRLRIGFMYKRTTLQNKKKEIITNFLQFVDHNQHPIPINNLLDTEVPEDAAVLETLKQHVADQSEDFQVRYLSLAPASLLDSLKIPSQLLAERLTFAPGARRKFTIMVIGKTGQGKSCLVNELHNLPEWERCAEFAGKSTGTVSLDSKTVAYKRPIKPEERAPQPQPPNAEQATSSQQDNQPPTQPPAHPPPTQSPPAQAPPAQAPSAQSPPTKATPAQSTPAKAPPAQATPAQAASPASPSPIPTPVLASTTDTTNDDNNNNNSSSTLDSSAGVSEDEMEVAVEIIDTPGIEAKSERQELVQGDIFERLSEGFVEGGSPVNVILHCLNPSVPRLDDIEHEWIRALSGYAPVILVYTHALTSPEDIQAWISSLKPPLPITADVQVLARDEETGAKKKTVIKRFGLVELVDALAEVYPISLAKIAEHIQNSNATSEEQLQNKKKKAYSVVAGAAAGGGVSGALPIPGADIAATIAVQGFMLAGINRIYGIPYDKSLLATLGSQMVWSAPATLISRAALAVIASSLKVIPFVDIAASFINAGLGIFFTTALGVAYVGTLDRVIRTHGNMLGIPKSERQRLIEEMFKEEAKKVAAEDMKAIKQKLEEEAMN